MSLFHRDDSPSSEHSLHVVFLPGSSTDWRVIDHGEFCQLRGCEVVATMHELARKAFKWPGRGEYHTFDGRNFVEANAPVPSRHRVHLTGPFHGGDFDMLDHGDTCEPVNGMCPVMEALFAHQDEHKAWQVEGEYFTYDGKNYERCAFQPSRR